LPWFGAQALQFILCGQCSLVMIYHLWLLIRKKIQWIQYPLRVRAYMLPIPAMWTPKNIQRTVLLVCEPSELCGPARHITHHGGNLCEPSRVVSDFFEHPRGSNRILYACTSSRYRIHRIFFHLIRHLRRAV
jgi:hypothetical protein